jgi:hypothetical protein
MVMGRVRRRGEGADPIVHHIVSVSGTNGLSCHARGTQERCGRDTKHGCQNSQSIFLLSLPHLAKLSCSTLICLFHTQNVPTPELFRQVTKSLKTHIGVFFVSSVAVVVVFFFLLKSSRRCSQTERKLCHNNF